ncbi:hypothetical protein Btru_034813 [Bulinus truncatus]|nr:hypothetical protein Btru_034813 [Bulinus truncatus]
MDHQSHILLYAVCTGVNTTLDRAVTSTTLDCVFINTTLDRAVTSITLDRAVTSTTLDCVFINTTLDRAVTNTTLDRAVTNTTLDRAVTNTTLDYVVTNTTLDRAVTNTTLDRAVTNITLDCAVTNTTLDCVVKVVFEMYSEDDKKKYQSTVRSCADQCIPQDDFANCTDTLYHTRGCVHRVCCDDNDMCNSAPNVMSWWWCVFIIGYMMSVCVTLRKTV